MTRLAPISARKMIKILKSLGFEEIRQKGSHIFFFHKENGCMTTVPDHGAKDLPVGLLHQILEDIKIGLDEFEKLR